MIEMGQSKWSRAHPVADEASELGKTHAWFSPLSKAAFLDLFDLNIDDCRQGYTATSLYHLYLDSRIQARMRGTWTEAEDAQSALAANPALPPP
ncbi:hypothetical protein AB0M50_34640 [Nonomuraea fuscirosea]|uniref:hypothetical protein n=1 Tax=Nonomuraea fuscirosea TaxID=1291556 RepID=UPI0034299F7D